MKSILGRIEKCIKTVDNGNCGTGCQTTTQLAKIHPYFATFKPGIATCMIDGISDPKDTVLDPFCGSGTTAIEGATHGRNVICSDVNPLASLITRVKLAPVNPDTIHGEVDTIKQRVQKDRSATVQRSIPYVKNIDHWFSPEAVRDLARLKYAIEITHNLDTKDFLATAFSRTVKKASKSVDGFDVEYRLPKNGKIKPSVDVIKTFDTVVDTMLEHVSEKPLIKQVNVLSESVRDLHSIPNESVDAIVTDPPYGAAIDYIHAFKSHINWLELADHLALKEEQIGNRYAKKSICRNYTPKYPTVKKILGLFQGDRRRDEVYSCDYATYFKYMEDAFQELHRVTRKGGKMIMRLGNNVAGFDGELREIPTTDAVIEIAGGNGWKFGGSFYRGVDNINGASMGMFRWKNKMKRERYMIFTK